MGKEFVGQDGGVGFDFDEVDGHNGDFGEDGAAQGVGEGEGDVGENEIDIGGGDVADDDAGSGRIKHGRVVVHDGW